MGYYIYVCPDYNRIYKVSSKNNKCYCKKCNLLPLRDLELTEEEWQTYSVEEKQNRINLCIDAEELIEEIPYSDKYNRNIETTYSQPIFNPPPIANFSYNHGDNYGNGFYNQNIGNMYVDPDYEDEQYIPPCKYAWILAIVPIIVAIITTKLGMGYYSTLICIILNCIFLVCDKKDLQNSGTDIEKYIWLGFVLVPIYLFVRASKIDRNYGYAITWCILFIAQLVI